MYNLHLGLIHVPPLCVVFPPNDLFHYSFAIKKARHILNSGQDFIDMTGDTGWPSWGSSWVILGIIPFLSKRDTPKSDQLYIYIYIYIYMYIYIYIHIKYYSNVTLFEPRRPGIILGTPKMTPSWICLLR